VGCTVSVTEAFTPWAHQKESRQLQIGTLGKVQNIIELSGRCAVVHFEGVDFPQHVFNPNMGKIAVLSHSIDGASTGGALGALGSPSVGMVVTATSEAQGAPRGLKTRLFRKGEQLRITKLQEENGEWYAVADPFDGLWFPMSSTDWRQRLPGGVGTPQAGGFGGAFGQAKPAAFGAPTWTSGAAASVIELCVSDLYRVSASSKSVSQAGDRLAFAVSRPWNGKDMDLAVLVNGEVVERMQYVPSGIRDARVVPSSSTAVERFFDSYAFLSLDAPSSVFFTSAPMTVSAVEASACEDLSAKAALTVSSAAHLAAKLLDGNLDTYWQSDDGGRPHWIQFAFPKSVTVQRILLYLGNAKDDSFAPEKITVKVGSTPDELTQVSEFDNRQGVKATGAWVDALQSSAAGKECQYLRMSIESSRGYNLRVRGVKLMASWSEGQPAQKVELAARLPPAFGQRQPSNTREPCQMGCALCIKYVGGCCYCYHCHKKWDVAGGQAEEIKVAPAGGLSTCAPRECVLARTLRRYI